MYSVTLQRMVGKRTSDKVIQNQIDKILEAAVANDRRSWQPAFHETILPHQENANGRGWWVFTYRLEFEKISGHKGGEAEYKQWERIKATIEMQGKKTCFNGQNWNIIAVNDDDAEMAQSLAPSVEQSSTPDGDADDNSPIQPAGFTDVVGDLSRDLMAMMGVRVVQPFGKAKTWSELHVPSELLGEDSDRHLAEHAAWRNLYGVNPQIRIILSNIKRAQETDGESRNHAVLFGHAGCGKTTTMSALETMFGSDSVLKLDATSTTKAGLEKLFFKDLTGDTPPLIFMEEAEKADPEALKIWLGALDDRGEIRKINFRVNHLRSIKILFICSVNNKNVFDRMMGSDGSEAGALSSRCVTQVYYPRPSEAVLYQILDKEIREKGGKHEWIAPAINIAKELNVTDPRTVRSYLAGGDRLLDGTYRRDWMAVNEAQKVFNKH